MNNATNPVRVRFAPSPTGHLHIGGLRTTLFNWLFAKHNNGKFLLRIEDTDRERSTQAYTDSIIASLEWLGLIPDEPIMIQSSRIDEHIQLAQALIEQGKAYRCICTQEEVLDRYTSHGGNPEQVKYDGKCRNQNKETDKPYVIRFAIPEDIDSIVFNDLIRGTVTIARDQLDDFIIVRSDGTPMYNFVVVADDAYMRISHIIRGEEHIINTPKQILLYQACNYAIPTFAHIPLVLGPSGQKLSKREAATSVIEYKKAGFLPEALINYLVRLGWSHGDQEKFTREELITYFDLSQVSSSGAIFDIEKLLWLNSVYMREKTDEQLYDLLHTEYGHILDNKNMAIPLIGLYKERTRALKELYDVIVNTIQGPAEYHDIYLQPLRTQQMVALLKQLVNKLEHLSVWNADSITNTIKIFAKEMHQKIADIMNPLRVALIGQHSGPGAGTLAALLGKEETVRRLTRLYDTIERM
ncbi:MAG TPA: glutamate--tRNA ligase, partial [Candidatus Babeliales bacterium]|nr:glutamate--tRNA ligase [Candidatus Babeliales bacterium]